MSGRDCNRNDDPDLTGRNRSLAPEREDELWSKLAASGDEDARDELIVSYRPWSSGLRENSG